MQVVWFKRDLRVVDHQPLAEAARAGPVMCLYIAEPEYWALPDTSGRQWAAIAEGLSELDAELRRRYGARLNVRIGDAVEVLAALHEAHGIQRLWSHEETGNLWTYARDRAVVKFCRDHAIVWTENRQFGVFRRLASRDNWAGRWEAMMRAPLRRRAGGVDQPQPRAVRNSRRKPPRARARSLFPAAEGRTRGGARAILKASLAGRGAGYVREMSSPLTAAEACSRLSLPISRRARCRCGRFFRRRCGRAPNAPRSRRRRARCRCARSTPSSAGCTGIVISFKSWRASRNSKSARRIRCTKRSDRIARRTPSIWTRGFRADRPAVRRCLHAFAPGKRLDQLSHARDVDGVASYHLALDWTRSGAALARLFADYEPGIHWPQVQMQSGQTGINAPRIYNPVKQSFDQDPEGAFIRKWVPEIAHLPLNFLHEPWRMTAADQSLHGCRLGKDYPQRIVDPIEAARAAKARLTAVRRLEGYRPAGKAVFAKHGSRKGRGDRRRRGRAREPPNVSLRSIW